MKHFFVLLILLVSSSAFAIRHVGNGGGEAELKIWQFAQFLPYWAQGCNTNPELCWNGGVLTDDLIKKWTNLKVEFANQTENKSLCSSEGAITLTHEELYTTPDKSKSDSELALIFIKSLLICQGYPPTVVANLDIKIAPQGRQLNNLGVFTLSDTVTDIIFLQGSTRNLHAELTQKMQCAQYQVTSADANGFLVQCKIKPETYLVMPELQNGELILNVRYNAEVDL